MWRNGNPCALLVGMYTVEATMKTRDHKDTTKGKNGKDLTEEEETKKRWQEYIEELYKKSS